MRAPETAGKITTAWLEHAVSHSVGDCRIVSWSIDNGFGAKSMLADVTRLALGHEASDCQPQSLIAKFPTMKPGVAERAASFGLYDTEATIYSLLSEHPDLPIPGLYRSYAGRLPGLRIIVLEDMSPGNARSQAVGCTVAEARQILLSLADIHALFWGDDRVPGFNPISFAEGSKRRFEENWPAFIDAYGERMGNAANAFDSFIANVQRMALHRGSRPSTLIHSDIHTENVLFYDDPSRQPVLIDWQLAGSGICAFDIAQLLVGGMEPADRREHQDKLLGAYFSRLTKYRDIDYSYQEFFLDYRASVVRSISRPVTQFGGFGGRLEREDRVELADALFERVVAAVEDLNPIEALQDAMRSRA